MLAAAVVAVAPVELAAAAAVPVVALPSPMV